MTPDQIRTASRDALISTLFVQFCAEQIKLRADTETGSPMEVAVRQSFNSSAQVCSMLTTLLVDHAGMDPPDIVRMGVKGLRTLLDEYEAQADEINFLNVRGTTADMLREIMAVASDVSIVDRILPDGRLLHVYPLMFGRARLLLSTPEDFKRGTGEKVCDYDTHEGAIHAMATWEGEGDPPGGEWR